MRRNIILVLLCAFALFFMGACNFGQTPNDDINTEQEQIYNLAVESGYKGTYEDWLESIRGDEVVLQVSNGYIQWKYSQENNWKVLISLSELTGQKGTDGKEVEFDVSDGFIKWRYVGESNSNWRMLVSLSTLTGADGKDGKTPEFRVSEGYIQWKYIDEDTWINLIAVSTVNSGSGKDGLTPEFKSNETHILWKYTVESDSQWRELISLDNLKGEQGAQGIQGKSAYETFKEYYPEYNGTEKDWITDMALGNTCNLFGHKWDEGVITTEPTKGNEGEKTYTCQTCNEHKYEVLPKIEVAEIYEVEGIKYVNYGSYPQTHVGDAALIAELNKLTETNDRGYYEYNGKEYAKVTTTPTFYGTASSTDKYGNVQYYTYTYSDGSTINRNVVEWFEVEPIKWRIISENADGSYQLYSEHILDVTNYCDYYYVRSIDGEDIYKNNYKYSNIRAWLNGYNGTDYKITDYTNKGFYNMAFKDNEKGAIITKEVDNSASTTTSFPRPNEYACENTFDKIYLLSYQDMRNGNYGFTDDESRYAQVTDYAKAVGAHWDISTQYLDNGFYWLRSPDAYDLDDYYACHVGYVGRVSHFYVDYSNNGVRVACTINLE